MNLYLIYQSVNNGYDTYDSAVVAAKSAVAARRIHPDGNGDTVVDKKAIKGIYLDCWATQDKIGVGYLGKAAKGVKEGEVICASFNAG